jgi:hypothetical protein
MGCGCNGSSGPIQSWYDVFRMMPENPLDLVAYATINGIVGSFSKYPPEQPHLFLLELSA